MKKLLKNLEHFSIFHLGEIERIKNAKDFYKELKYGLETSKEAFIASMYFGEDDETYELIKLIEKRNENDQRTMILLDYSRGLTDDLKQKIIKHRLSDNFYFKVMNYSFLPRRVSEMLSVFHSKIIMFDSKMIVTGANINHDYFSRRLDRYYSIENSELVNLMIGSIFIPIIQNHKNINGIHMVVEDLGTIHNSQYVNYISQDSIESSVISNILEEQNNRLNYADLLETRNITTDPKIIVYDEATEYDVVEALIKRGFKEMYISTSYLNLPYPYLKLLKETNVKIIVNDPISNIFTEYGRFGSLVTKIYNYSTFRTALNLPKAQIYEFRRDGYTMHKKGIWAFTGNVAATVIGSSNLNRRSASRDNELNFMLLSSDPVHVETIRSEIKEIMSYTKLRSLENLKNRDYSLLIILLFVVLNRYI